MLNICIFGGTTEGRELIKFLSDKKALITACVATEYGEEAITDNNVTIHVGKLDYDNMVEFFHKNKFDLIIDATHPYAKIVTQNIKNASQETKVKYLRLNRDKSKSVEGKYFSDIDGAINYLCKTSGNILLTTGSNELSKFTKIPNYKERIYPRILPLATSLEACKINGYDSSHIIAMQGPYTEELNIAIINAFNIKILVTKESGVNGGFIEKIKAAKTCNVECVIINRPDNKEGYSYNEITEYLNKIIDEREIRNDGFTKIEQQIHMDSYSETKITIIGIGVGNKNQMTLEAIDAIKNSDVIIGAKRMLENCESFNKPKCCAFMPKDVLEYINNNKQYKNIAILMSGDVGFYSGAKKLLDTLKAYKVNLVCGISSPVYLCSRLGFSWDDMSLYSLHGKNSNIIHSIKTNFRTFTLVGGEYGVLELCELLCKYNLNYVKLYVGERLTYIDEKITVGKADELIKKSFDKLASVIIENENYNTKLNVGISDDEFVRYDKVPMTKSEVRAVSISKLNLSNDSIVYDIGAGSGSISIEAAILSHNGMVYAVEKKHDAIDLIEENKRKFGTPNVIVVEGCAPDVMADLPIPTHAFIGGTSGNLKEIIKKLLEKNKNIRIVINAITIETVSEAVNCINEFNLKNAEIVNLSISKSKKIGGYNMMIGQNPIYIISCNN